VVVGTGFAADPTKEKIARTPAGDAAAATLVVRKRDLPAGWSGGSVKPDLSSSMGCSSYYEPKQSDLVVIGAAETRWRSGTSSLDSQTQVLRTPKMVRLDWQRTVADPHVLPCLRQSFVKHTPTGEKLVSLRWISVPKLGVHARSYRLTLALVSQTPALKVAVDALVFGAGRNEISLIASGLSSDETSFHKLQVRLARRLAQRLHG
jgi:hypothetical protein